MQNTINLYFKAKKIIIPHDTDSRVDITPRTWRKRKELFGLLHWTVTERNITVRHFRANTSAHRRNSFDDTCTVPQTPKVGPPTEPFKSLSSQSKRQKYPSLALAFRSSHYTFLSLYTRSPLSYVITLKFFFTDRKLIQASHQFIAGMEL